jgi:hypothetical protein
MTERIVRVQIVAQIGYETWELGSGMVGEANPLGECVDLLRTVADDLERPGYGARLIGEVQKEPAQ